MRSCISSCGVIWLITTDFEAFEILAKPWGACISRPAPDQKKNENPKRKRDASSQRQPEEEVYGDAQERQDGQRQTATSFPALLSHFLQQPSSQSASWCSADLSALGDVAPSPPKKPSEIHSAEPSRISSYHYQLPMKGHTGYVTYCVKPSEDENLQPQP